MRIRPTAGTLIATLDLAARPEGGHARRTWGVDAPGSRRPGCTATLHLIASDDSPAWHRVDATEVWLFQGGDPLELATAIDDGAEPARHVLGTEVVEGQSLQVAVPAKAWRSARTLGSWTLVSRVASPGSLDEDAELAPVGWHPGSADGTAAPMASGAANGRRGRA